MERRKFTREFKLEAVRLIADRDVAYAQAKRDPGGRRAGAVGTRSPMTMPQGPNQRWSHDLDCHMRACGTMADVRVCTDGDPYVGLGEPFRRV